MLVRWLVPWRGAPFVMFFLLCGDKGLDDGGLLDWLPADLCYKVAQWRRGMATLWNFPVSVVVGFFRMFPLGWNIGGVSKGMTTNNSGGSSLGAKPGFLGTPQILTATCFSCPWILNNYVPTHETQAHKTYNLTYLYARNICTSTKRRPQSIICFSVHLPQVQTLHSSTGSQSTQKSFCLNPLSGPLGCARVDLSTLG